MGIKNHLKLKNIELVVEDYTWDYASGGDSRPVYSCINLCTLEKRDLEKHNIEHAIYTKINPSDLKGEIHKIQALLLTLIDNGYTIDQSVILVNIVYLKLEQISKRSSILKKMIQYEFEKKEVMKMFHSLSMEII